MFAVLALPDRQSIRGDLARRANETAIPEIAKYLLSVSSPKDRWGIR